MINGEKGRGEVIIIMYSNMYTVQEIYWKKLIIMTFYKLALSGHFLVKNTIKHCWSVQMFVFINIF